MKELKLPLVVKWGTGLNSDYTLTEGSEGMVTAISHTGSVYVTTNSVWDIMRYIENGIIVVKAAPACPSPDTTDLKINIDSSAVTSALAQASELEATLLRIKEMMK